MRNTTLGAALSALLVAVPAAGAFAGDADLSPADRAYEASVASTVNAASGPGARRLAAPAVQSPVDYVYTSSIASPVGKANAADYGKLLDGQLAAAQANLSAGRQSGFVDPTGAERARADLLAVQRHAAQDRQTNGGQLSQTAYDTLSGQIRTVNQSIHALIGG